MKQTGRIIKIHSGIYTVETDSGVFECSARGVLKIKSDGIVTGDFVEVENNVVTSVLKRKNCFMRPAVANVDAVAVVISCPPKPDYLMIDKLILSVIKEGIELFIIVNKTDLENKTYLEIAKTYRGLGIDIIAVSALNGDGTDKLFELFRGKVVAFAGQSAVGKTTLINLFTGLNMKTGDISEKSQRGKHTTTVSEIISCNNGSFSVIDTPGFSALRGQVESRELEEYYPEFDGYREKCRFRKCLHINEPGCAVKAAVEGGEIDSERYSRYLTIYNELLEENKNKYE